MGYQNHRGTMGHKVGSSIIGKDQGPVAKEPDGDEGAALSGFDHIHVRPAANGFTVSHTPKTKGTGSPAEPAAQEQSHVFRDAEEAHNHIGQLLGLRMASGLQKT